MTEPREIRLKRLTMRSMRRGIKEMDVLLMRYSAARLAELSDSDLDRYEQLLDEADQDLYQWISGQVEPPAVHQYMVAEIARIAASR